MKYGRPPAACPLQSPCGFSPPQGERHDTPARSADCFTKTLSSGRHDHRASTGIGYELAKCAAQAGFDLIVAADETSILDASEDFQRLGADVVAVVSDLSTRDGVTMLCDAVNGRAVDVLKETREVLSPSHA